MKINVFKENRNVDLELNVECVIPVQDVFVAFVRYDGDMAHNMAETYLFDEFYFRKINHIIEATTKFERQVIHLTIGFYFSGAHLYPFIISQDHPKKLTLFKSDLDDDEVFFDSHVMFNYKEYAELLPLGFEKLSFEEYVKKLIYGKMHPSQNRLYNFHKGDKSIKNYILEDEMDQFHREQDALAETNDK